MKKYEVNFTIELEDRYCNKETARDKIDHLLRVTLCGRLVLNELRDIISAGKAENEEDKKMYELYAEQSKNDIKTINDANTHYMEVLEVTENIRKEVEKAVSKKTNSLKKGKK